VGDALIPTSETDTFFMDDSGFGSKYYIYTGIYIPRQSAEDANSLMLDWRQSLLKRYGISADYELHATSFVNNRGRPAGPYRPVFEPTRIKIFLECLQMITRIPDVKLLNTLSTRKDQMEVFGRLLNRLQVAARSRNSTVKILCDKGKESEMNRILRRMHLSNLIPSKYGIWSDGNYFRDVKLDRVAQDITYLDSRDSHFIQAADFCAYSILRWKAEDLPNRTRNNLHLSYRMIEPIFEKRAFKADPHGIIRA
jgi:hypothetical protein